MWADDRRLTMADEVLTQSVTVLNYGGIHLRAASLLVTTSRGFEADVWVAKDNHVVDAKSEPLQLLAMGIGEGEVLELRARGTDAQAALDALVELFAARFHEPIEENPQSSNM